MTEVEKFEALAADIERKRADCVRRGTELCDERSAISLAACTGDAKAAKRLTELHGALALHGSELESLDAAAKSAAEKLAAAEHAVAVAAARQNAEEARKLVGELAEVFPYVDKSLTAALKGLLAINDGITQLHKLGFTAPSDAMVRLGIAAIIQTWAHNLPRGWHDQLRDGLQFLAPHERKTASQYFDAIKPALDNQLRQRLGEAERSDTEAA